MIRRATPKDVPRLLQMGAEFFKMSAFHAMGGVYDPGSMEQTFESLFKSPDAVVFVAQAPSAAEAPEGEVIGAVGAVVASLFFNLKIKTANEFFWYVDPAHRGQRTALRLYLALEQWAKEKGVDVLGMAALKNSPQAVRDYYAKAGFHESETSYMKRLQPLSERDQ